jgi:hypothetical protein
MKRILLSIVILACAATGLASSAAAQARPLPGPDVQQIYQRLLPTIPMLTPWLRLQILAPRCARAMTILS